MYVYAYPVAMYLRCEDATLAILCMDPLITTTIAGKWFNNLILYDNSKYIIANEQVIIYVDADPICHVMIIYFEKLFLEVLSHSNKQYGFRQLHMNVQTVHIHIHAHCNDVIHGVH